MTFIFFNHSPVTETSQIGMAPRSVGFSTPAHDPQRAAQANDPDFINSQAIVARALTMCMAYPQIHDAVSELFSSVPNSPELKVNGAAFFGVAGTEATFGAVQRMVNDLYESRAVLLGYLDGPVMRLGVVTDETIKWDAQRFVYIIREGAAAGAAGSAF